MSIIEKAVSNLEKQTPPAKEEEQIDGREPAVGAADTVQKAAREITEGESREKEEPRARRTTPAGVINLPFQEMQARGMLTPAVPRSNIADEYRTIKRPLLRNIAGESAVPIDNANLIMVTSALQSDGKTFSSINLAMSIAMEQDKTVLFVDADTAKAEAGRLLGVSPTSPGLIDVLENKGIGLEDVILRTNVEKLRILPAGNLHSHANELLASESMRLLMLELSQRYSDRVIVFDSPPLLLTTEAGVLASFMGQIAFVVRADSTPQQAVTEALEHIPEDKVVGMVLNQARRHRFNLFGYGYGYGYGRKGYGYGYGYGHRGREAEAEA